MKDGPKNPYLTPDMVLELLPSVVFVVLNFAWNFEAATIGAMVSTIACVAIGYFLRNKIPVIALITLVIVVLLNSASLYFDDDVFVKIRPTIGSCLFALALTCGLYIKPMFLERVLDNFIVMSRKGWQVLHYCWILFALCRAALNELVWRLAATDIWVIYKTAEDFVTIGGYILITWLIAKRYWKV